MTNTINADTIALTKRSEGCRFTAYPDPASGNTPWTIGYGHTAGVHKGDVITQAQAEQFLAEDLAYAGRIVLKYVKVPLNDNQYGVLADFVMNVGEGTFAKSSVLSYVNAKQFDRVPGRLALYRLASGKVMPGLVRRRAEEGALWLKPVDGEVIVDPVEVGSNLQATADHNDKKPWDWGAAGAFLTLMASISNDAKTAIGNFTEAVGLQPWQFLLVIGAGFGVYTLWNKFKKDK